MRIHFIDVGQGDCTLIELPDGKVALIDGGDGRTSTKKSVMRYLNALDIDVIDHLVVTHTDRDHCGALDAVFRYKKVVNAYLPHTYDVDDVEYAEMYALAIEENCSMVDHARSIDLSNAEAGYTFRFLYPNLPDSSTVPSLDSAALWLDYKGVSALFYGDGDKKTENILLRDDRAGVLAPFGVRLSSTEILKVAHHGSDGATSQEFVEYLGVKTAVVSCGEDNPYGHPKADVVNRLQEVGAEIYRTDEQGNVIVTVKSDGAYTVKTVND